MAASRFRTIELSDPRFETDHLRFMTVKTPHLKGRGDICVFEPPGVRSGQTLPVIILLHGVYGSAWSWAYGAGVHRQVMALIREERIPPVILAMPSDGLWGDGSAYLPHSGYDFEKWIGEDVPEALIGKIAGAANNSPLFISGLSMGGFGALRIGARYGDRFRGISAHSSITALDQMKLFVEEDLSRYSQANKAGEEVLGTLRQYRDRLPPIRFDCGRDDLLIEYNRDLHRRMTGQGIPHEYEEFPGGHEWPYWEEHVGKSVLFFARQLGAPQPG